ncbi:uncharacterized protein (DUF302 family) [Christiangramia gaetbulicola]|uniref:Uncharacterized protein (DUF302 family) n=1 Tax=Christiangramia gaetbulicola TaxID=703340 RepID=A0A2T6AKG7_9FLAO|nr:DUF302 domain-containing protein [Christiangramia gaetbulicola]PTX44311.1 uncharacterized protein (DUF302 family) [Christiangramia gaetbulicola]
MKAIILLAAIIFLSVSFSQNQIEDKTVSMEQDMDQYAEKLQTSLPIGVNYAFSKVNISEAYDHLKQKLDNNPAISIIAEVDHAANARSINEALNFNRIIFFGNPKLGTPLMQKNQLAGLDLPQKILFYEDPEKKNMVLYNSVDYLRSRHDLEGVLTLNKISNALEGLVRDATKSEVLQVENSKARFKEGIITEKSNRNFEDTYTSLKNIIEANPRIRIMAELDHQKNAARVGMQLNPTRIIIFGNPNLGTPLMQEKQSISLDLPQKMLVWENSEEEVYVSYNDPYYIAKRPSVENKKELLDKMAKALAKIARTAAGN